MDIFPERISWKEQHNAIELGFDHYLDLLEKRLSGEDISLVQGLRTFFKEGLGIDLRETQARGLMHRSSSAFIDYVRETSGQTFVPGVQYWENVGLQGFREWRDQFHGIRERVAVDIDIEEQEIDEFQERFQERPDIAPGRKRVTITRIVRDTSLSRFLKSLYDYECQICERTFGLPSGGKYAESHHLRPLGNKHGGVDHQSNMLVLCPNHHAMFDFGVIAVHPRDLRLLAIGEDIVEQGGQLSLLRHRVDSAFLEYHLDCVYNRVL